MLTRALALAALLVTSVSAQESPENAPFGFSVGYGFAAPEAIAFPTTSDDYFLAFDDGRLVDVAVFGSASSYARDTQTGLSVPEPLVQFRDGVDRRIGLAVGVTFDVPVGEIRAGASGAYVYDRDQRTDYVLVDGGPKDPRPRLELDLDTSVLSEDQRLYGALGVSWVHSIEQVGVMESNPAIGIAVGSYDRRSGRVLSNPRRAVAYLHLPLRVFVGEHLRLGFGSTVGIARESRSDADVRPFLQPGAVYSPETQVTFRAEF